MSDSRAPSLVATPHRLTLSSPDALLAAIPHLLGFPPRDSVVLVGLGADGAGRESIQLTQRFDRPSDDLSGEELVQLARTVAAPMRACGSSSVIVAVFADEQPTAPGVLPSTAFVDELVDALDEGGLWVTDSLYTDGATRWAYGCESPSCCPTSGVPISDELRTMVAAEFAGAGAAMASSRQALTDEVAADPARIKEVTAHLPAHEQAASGDLEGWRDETIEQIAGLRSDPNPSAATLGAVVAGLRDTRVRDTALWELAMDPDTSGNVISGLTMAVRSAPQGQVAPAATVLAIQHWTRGDGARANACLNRAVVDDPGYSLAAMTGSAMSGGLPPSSWTNVMSQLDRGVCRNGSNPPAPAATIHTTPPPPITSVAPGLAS
jgi:hypothetical protein